MGSSPPCWGQRAACVAAEHPRFSVALRRPGPLWGAETGGSAPAPGGPGRGQAGVTQSWLPASLLLLRITWLASLAHLQPGTRCVGFSPLEVTHQPWGAGLGCEKGRLAFPDAGRGPAFTLCPGRASHVAGPAH